MTSGSGLKDATAIVGIGQTPFARHLADDERTLACRAVLAALDDAGIAPGEVDALASYTMEETESALPPRTACAAPSASTRSR